MDKRIIAFIAFIAFLIFIGSAAIYVESRRVIQCDNCGYLIGG
jgi:hypothetical protein